MGEGNRPTDRTDGGDGKAEHALPGKRACTPDTALFEKLSGRTHDACPEGREAKKGEALCDGHSGVPPKSFLSGGGNGAGTGHHRRLV